MALTFEYKVRDRQGNLVEGQLEADSMSLVVGKLREMGYLPISVKPRSRLSARTEITIPGLTNRVKLAELAVATRQLATMIDSGLSVVRSLAILATQVESKELARVLGEVRLEVERGSSLSAACAQHPKVFSHLFVTMVQAGEAGGSLDAVLQQLATTMEKQAALNRKIRSAMTYPAVVLSVMIVIFTALLVFVVPIFKRIFTQLHATLPGPTQAVLKISAIVTSPWVLVVLAVLALALVVFKRWIGTDRGRRAFDGFKLKPPVFGPLLHKVALARFAGTLSSLVAAGVPILESLDICSDTSGNQVVADALQAAKNGVREGRSLADCLKEHEAVVPSLVTQMVEVGEQTGALDAMLRKAADFYDQEVETTVANLTQLLEPMLTVIMGAGVGTMVICMYLPMFDYIKHVPTS
ncbi:type II secretion system F family protein [Aciditerrimonas ferrireducens]|uniref:type II secretion system F family protein n=1 Tax=Aciditerrimonas ferrireducens TaxID=667306 RepID=UPI002005BF8A|nr:type II secretion system F family protein [Aciditerrimonas ferrireducens]MCK4176543.1 type II secretion system F family protein [Aciditerrimonas ferrireducens]